MVNALEQRDLLGFLKIRPSDIILQLGYPKAYIGRI